MFVCELSLLIRAGDFWYVSSEVGKEVGSLKAKVVTEEDQQMPPLRRWQFLNNIWTKPGTWEFDPTMVCTRKLSTACSQVKVELDGGAKKTYPKLAGSYLPVEGVHQRGRPVGCYTFKADFIA